MTQSETLRPRVLLVGMGPTATSALVSLCSRFRVVALIREAPPEDETVLMARKHGVPVLGTTAISNVTAAIQAVEPDAVVVSSYDRILPETLVASRPFVNVHYAPLPRYRGRATVNWAIINGEPSAAITIHALVAGLDAGGILFQQSVPIGPRSTASQLYATLNDLQEQTLADSVIRYLQGDGGKQQDEALATYSCTRVPDDGHIDWSDSTIQIDRLVRALTDPFPGAYTWNGLQRLWVDQAEPVEDPPLYEGRVPGRVVRVSRRDGHVDVLTGDGVLRLHAVRVGVGARCAAAEVVRSVRQTLGLRVTDLVARLMRVEASVPVPHNPDETQQTMPCR